MVSKLKNDLKFIDPSTMQVICTVNGCIEKFEPDVRKETTNNKARKEYGLGPFEFDYHSHKCTECGRSFQTRKDASASKMSYKMCDMRSWGK